MGCTGSKDVGHGSTPHHTQQGVPQQQVYGIPQQSLPPSTLPQGWISQWDPSKQRLYYVYPQTGQVTWTHPLGPGADAQEMQRFYQIQSMQQQQQGGHNRTQFADSYNRGGGFGPGAGMAMGLMAGKCGAMGLMAGSVLGAGMTGGYGGDMVPADVSYGGEDFGGGDFGGGDFGGGDFGGGF